MNLLFFSCPASVHFFCKYVQHFLKLFFAVWSRFSSLNSMLLPIFSPPAQVIINSAPRMTLPRFDENIPCIIWWNNRNCNLKPGENTTRRQISNTIFRSKAQSETGVILRSRWKWSLWFKRKILSVYWSIGNVSSKKPEYHWCTISQTPKKRKRPTDSSVSLTLPIGAAEWIWTTTRLPPPAPQAGASAVPPRPHRYKTRQFF